MPSITKLCLGIFFSAFLSAMRLPCQGGFNHSYTTVTEVVQRDSEPLVRKGPSTINTHNVNVADKILVYADGSQAIRSVSEIEEQVAIVDSRRGIQSEDYLERLGLTEDARTDDVEFAYRLRVDVISGYGAPDAEQDLLKLEEAYHALKTPEGLAAYKKSAKTVDKIISVRLSDIADEVLIRLKGQQFEQAIDIVVHRSTETSQHTIVVERQDLKNLLASSFLLTEKLKQLFVDQQNVDSVTMTLSQDILGTSSVKIFSTTKETIVSKVLNGSARRAPMPSITPYPHMTYALANYCNISFPVYLGGQCVCYNPSHGFYSGCD